jgi:hypothetical protein
VPIVLKSGSLKLLEPSEPVQACNGIALPLPLPYLYIKTKGTHCVLRVASSTPAGIEFVAGRGRNLYGGGGGVKLYFHYPVTRF